MKKVLWIVLTVIIVLSIFQYAAMAVVKYSYETDISPLIAAKKCADCHSFMKMYTRMSLWSTGAIDMHAHLDENGNVTGPLPIVDDAKLLINTAVPDSSLILWRITGLDLSTGEEILRMPIDGQYYTEGEIQSFKDWISQGAPFELPVDVEDTHTWLEVKKQFK